jgi:hypothetical protein
MIKGISKFSMLNLATFVELMGKQKTIDEKIFKEVLKRIEALKKIQTRQMFPRAPFEKIILNLSKMGKNEYAASLLEGLPVTMVSLDTVLSLRNNIVEF